MFLITCEHGGNRVPRGLAGSFASAGRVLATHRAYDLGALELARALAEGLHAPLVFSEVTRLVIDMNRSVGHPGLFSEYTRGLAPEKKREILRHYYEPYGDRVQEAAAERIAQRGCVRHVSVHSFAPVLRGQARRADVAWLYDPSRPGEKALCAGWLRSLRALRPDLRLRRNYPYRGTSDGLTTALRRVFPAEEYVGVELEVNQRWPRGGGLRWREMQGHLVASLLASSAEGAGGSQATCRSFTAGRS